MLINLRENWLIKNPAKAFSAAAGVFVMAALIFYLFYQGGYYYKKDLLKYLPASTAAFIQVKQPLFIQKETDAKLDGLYRPLEQINFFMGFGDNFNTNFFSRPPNEFIYFLYDSDEGLKKAYIAKTNNKNFRVANLVNHNYFWLDKNFPPIISFSN